MGFGKNWKVTFSNVFQSIFNNFIQKFLWIFLFFIFFFSIYRFALFAINFNEFKNIPIEIIFKSFLVGLRFDTSVVLYPLSIFFLFNYLLYFFNKHNLLQKINIAYLTLIFFLFAFLSLVEIEFYRYFHFRLNIYVLNIEKNPKFISKMIWESYPVVPYVFLLIVLTVISFIVFKRILKEEPNRPQPSLFFKFISFVLFSILIFLGIRGTTSHKTPLRWGHAFFSTYNQCNKLALNGIFTLVDDILKNPTEGEDIDKIFPNGKNLSVEELQKLISDSTALVLKFPERTYSFQEMPKKYNVVIFLLESFSMQKIEEFTSKGIPLFINELKKEAVFFENIYSNGIHTNMGLFSSLFGLPNIMGKSVMVRSHGQKSLNGLTNVLKENGYVGYFAVSHDPNFDNMAGFLRCNGVDFVVSQFDFPQSLVLSTLGIPDHILFEKMNQIFAQSKQPFFAVILSTNNHGPWIVPKVEGQSFHSTFDYTDWALKHFFDLARKENYFENTIFIVTADHGLVQNPKYDLPLEGFHIPLVIFAPKLFKPEVRKTIGSQIDIQNTVLSLLRISFSCSNMGRNLFDFNPNKEQGFAIFHEGQTLGMIYNDWLVVDRLKSKCSIYKYKSNNPFIDYSDIYPDTANFFKNVLEGLYYNFNKNLLNLGINY